jgi:hypothetical protein
LSARTKLILPYRKDGNDAFKLLPAPEPDSQGDVVNILVQFKATLQNGYLRIRKEFRMDICCPPGLDAGRKSDKQTLRQGHTSNAQRNAVTR